MVRKKKIFFSESGHLSLCLGFHTYSVLQSSLSIEIQKTWVPGTGGCLWREETKVSVCSAGVGLGWGLGGSLPQQALNCAWSRVAGPWISRVPRLQLHVSH